MDKKVQCSYSHRACAFIGVLLLEEKVAKARKAIFAVLLQMGIT